jgi:hypothetical protein
MPKKSEDFFPYPEGNFFDEGIPKGVISPSGFNTYRRCPRQYEYAYVLGIINPPAFTMARGTALHKGAEVVHKHTIETGNLMELSEAQQAVVDCWEEAIEEVEDWKDKDGNEIQPGSIKDSAIKSFYVYYTQAVPLITPIAAEKPFAMKIGTVPVRGVIDLIDSVQGEYSLGDNPDAPPPKIEVVSDLKTTTKLWPSQKLEQEPQLTFYAIVENTRNVRVDFLLDQKKGAKYVASRTTRTNNDKRVLVEDLEEVVHLIKQGVFPRCDPTSWACTPKFCGYYDRCRGPK